MTAFHRRIAERGGPTHGLFLTLASPITTEICANAGFDWLILDAEHGPYEPSSMLPLLQAMAPYPVEPVVRLPVADVVLCKRYLDMGVNTIIVPMVESAGQARTMAAAVRYPPHGIRGVGAGLARASRWGADAGYLGGADARVTLIVQIESVAGLANLDPILAVEGIHGVFVGPADLAASLGYLGQPRHPDVQSAVEHAIAATVRAGRIAGYFGADRAAADRAAELGATMIAVGSDCGLLMRSARSLAESFAPPLTPSTSL